MAVLRPYLYSKEFEERVETLGSVMEIEDPSESSDSKLRTKKNNFLHIHMLFFGTNVNYLQQISNQQSLDMNHDQLQMVSHGLMNSLSLCSKSSLQQRVI